MVSKGGSPALCPECELFDECLGVNGRADFVRREVEQRIAEGAAKGMTARQRTALRRQAAAALRHFDDLEAKCPRAPFAP
jgi:hypothetical protein